MNDLETQFEHSMFNSGWQDETPKRCHGKQIHLSTKMKIHFLGQEVFVYQIWDFFVLKWLR